MIKIQDPIAYVNKYFEVYLKDRDYAGLKDFFSNEMTVIGTGINDIGNTSEETFKLYQSDLREVVKPISYSDLITIVNYRSDDFCIVSGSFSINGEVDDLNFSIPNLRYTFNLLCENGYWKIIHAHISVPFDEQVESELYPIKRLKEQNELLNSRVRSKTKELAESNTKLIKSNATKDKLFSIISHDLRTPFNSILGFSELLQVSIVENKLAETKKYASILYEQSKRSFNLLDGILNWSRTQLNKIHPSSEIVNIFELGEKVVHENELMANEKGVSLFLNLEVNLNCFADPGMVKIVLHNLISNAIKFTPKGGSVIVDSKSFSNYIEISVKDDGIGIDEDEVKDIFNFEKKKLHIGTNKEKGTGLGLDVCREFVDANGGLIWAESNIGKGTVIYFTLPSRYSSSAEGQDNAYQEFSN